MLDGRGTAIVTSGMLAAVMLAFRCPEWLHADSWRVALVHHFFHANVFHLAVNCLSLWLMLRVPSVRIGWRDILAAYACATASWFFATRDVIGASNFIFALAGLRTPSFRSGWWRRSSVRTFLAVTVFMAVFPQVSALTHIVSFGLGCVFSAVFRTFNRISHDLARISSH